MRGRAERSCRSSADPQLKSVAIELVGQLWGRNVPLIDWQPGGEIHILISHRW